ARDAGFADLRDTAAPWQGRECLRGTPHLMLPDQATPCARRATTGACPGDQPTWRPASTGVRYMTFSHTDTEALREAKRLLEHPGMAARLSNLIGSPIERSLAALPSAVATTITDVTRRAIEKGLNVALKTMNAAQPGEPSNRWHKLAVGASGAMGGAFGMAALA